MIHATRLQRWLGLGLFLLLAFLARAGGQDSRSTGGMEWPQWGGPHRIPFCKRQGALSLGSARESILAYAFNQVSLSI